MLLRTLKARVESLELGFSLPCALWDFPCTQNQERGKASFVWWCGTDYKLLCNQSVVYLNAVSLVCIFLLFITILGC